MFLFFFSLPYNECCFPHTSKPFCIPIVSNPADRDSGDDRLELAEVVVGRGLVGWSEARILSNRLTTVGFRDVGRGRL
jgi:hypothetical protein